MVKISDMALTPQSAVAQRAAPTARPASSFVGRLSPTSANVAAQAQAGIVAQHDAQLQNAAAGLERVVVNNQQTRTFAAQPSQNPFEHVSEAELQAVMADVMANDPTSMPMKLLRLQYKIQRQSLHFQFESNTAKSDHDQRKEILQNVK